MINSIVSGLICVAAGAITISLLKKIIIPKEGLPLWIIVSLVGVLNDADNMVLSTVWAILGLVCTITLIWAENMETTYKGLKKAGGAPTHNEETEGEKWIDMKL